MSIRKLWQREKGMLIQTKPSPQIRTREIADADIGAMAEFLGEGIGYPAEAYLQIFRILKNHRTPEGFPKYGYLLEANGSIAGGIILIFSATRGRDGPIIRCHVTGWCVDPAYRSYAVMFAQKALRHKNVTYMNLSARPAAIPIIEAQGFTKFSRGQFAAVPLLSSLLGRSDGKAAAIDAAPEGSYDPYDRDLLAAHQAYGCIAFWCVASGRAYPFVFQPRSIKRVIPGAQLIYCRDMSDLARFAAPIGRHLARHGRFLICIDANEAIKGLLGRYFDGVQPRWYRGPKPRLGDLAYTLPAMFPPSG
jgi:hypothetical protein